MAHRTTPSPGPERDVTSRLLSDADEEDLELQEISQEYKREEPLHEEPAWRSQWKSKSCWQRRRVQFAPLILCAAVVLLLIYIRLGELYKSTHHAIDRFITDANVAFTKLTAEGNYDTVEKAAAAYRKRRGRHPPPLFDKWFEWAKEHDCVHYEFMFDQIYEDVEPFWGADAAKVRRDAASWPIILTVRDGVAGRRRELPPAWASRDIYWEDMLKYLPSQFLPDVDLPLNCDDKAHIFTPWEEINEYVQTAARTKKIRPASEMIQQHSSYPPPPPADFGTFKDYPSEDNLWLLARDTCPPDSQARQLIQDPDLTTPSMFPERPGKHMIDGFVANWTASKDPCVVPELRNLHGLFVNSHPSSAQHWHEPDPNDRMVTRQFFPLFSPSKVQGVNNDIVIPPSTSWTDLYFANDNVTWDQKHNEVFWRGSATGGSNNATNWTRFHRHRLASASNGTQVGMQEEHPFLPAHVPGGNPALPYNIPLPQRKVYRLAATSGSEQSDLARWTSSWADVKFTHLFCHRVGKEFDEHGLEASCPYSSEWYDATPDNNVPMWEMYIHKYLPDVDGHGYSGRYRSFMDSDSVPIKATIWNEWSHSRLFAWKHFVPMDNTFMDLYGLAEYFIGYQPPDGSSRKSKDGHDAEAKLIADAGRQWASKVLRKDDMALYFWRVILEYARAVDDRREDIGYVQDLL